MGPLSPWREMWPAPDSRACSGPSRGQGLPGWVVRRGRDAPCPMGPLPALGLGTLGVGRAPPACPPLPVTDGQGWRASLGSESPWPLRCWPEVFRGLRRGRGTGAVRAWHSSHRHPLWLRQSHLGSEEAARVLQWGRHPGLSPSPGQLHHPGQCSSCGDGPWMDGITRQY